VLDWLGEDRAEGEANPRLMEVFTAFDTDGGGNLDVAELTAGLQSFDIYLTKAQVIGLMPSADADDDKVVRNAYLFRLALTAAWQSVRV
jgi:Ca2+-binding EF-hand superfamily protein